MVNAFCSAVIMFLVSMTQDARLHNIIFWLMGDMSMTDLQQVGILSAVLILGFILIFCLSHAMNLLLMSREMAMSMGLQLKTITVTLLVATSFMVSATVSHCGLIGFVGRVSPICSEWFWCRPAFWAAVPIWCSVICWPAHCPSRGNAGRCDHCSDWSAAFHRFA